MVGNDGIAAVRHRFFVALLDQQPVLAPLASGLAAHPHQRPVSVQLLAFEREFKRSLAIGRLGVRILWNPGAAIPQEHGPAAIFTLWDDAFERAVIERMVLDMDGEALLSGIEARPFGDCPALQDAVELEAEIVMQPPRSMLLNDKGEPGVGLSARPSGSGRLRRLPKIAFASVFLESHARAYRQAEVHFNAAQAGRHVLNFSVSAASGTA